jgi:hypothetical protein
LNRYVTEEQLALSKTLQQVNDLRRRLGKIEGLGVQLSDEGRLTLRLTEVESDEDNAPSGTHDLAQGFLLFSRMLAVRSELGNRDLWWEEQRFATRRFEPTGTRVQVLSNGHRVKRGDRDEEGDAHAD